MVTCNLCGENKSLVEFTLGFMYVCKDCWAKLDIYLDGEKIDKEVMY